MTNKEIISYDMNNGFTYIGEINELASLNEKRGLLLEKVVLIETSNLISGGKTSYLEKAKMAYNTHKKDDNTIISRENISGSHPFKISKD